MKKKPKDEPIGRLTVVSDFLPPPNRLVPKEDTVKITLAVDDVTLSFFKAAAKHSNTKYQRMMREVLKHYARKYQKAG